MRKKPVIPRIIKIQKVDEFSIHCMFNNGENRLLNFETIFNSWSITKTDVEYPLLKKGEFAKVELRNNTLSWNNIEVKLLGEDGTEEIHPYELSHDELFKLSEPVETMKFGNLIRKAREKAGLTQAQLAERSGTSRFYISRLENNRTDVELSTFRKIVEAGLGKHFRLIIE